MDIIAKIVSKPMLNLALSATLCVLLLIHYIDNDVGQLNVDQFASGIGGICAGLHAVHALFLSYFVLFSKPREQSDLEIVLRNLLSTLLVLLTAMSLGLKIRPGKDLGLTLAIVLLAGALRVADVFDDLGGLEDVLAVQCDEPGERTSKNGARFNRLILANSCYAFGAFGAVIQALSEMDGKAGKRNDENLRIQHAALSLLVIHAGLKLVTFLLDKIFSLKNLVARVFLDGCDPSSIELASLNQLPLVLNLVSSSILILSGMQLGETVDDGRAINAISFGVILYFFGLVIGRNII